MTEDPSASPPRIAMAELASRAVAATLANPDVAPGSGCTAGTAATTAFRQ
jgi:hypothetical protein